MAGIRSVFSFPYAVFDLDGTLVDSIPTFCEVFAGCLAPYGVDPAEAANYYTSTTGQPMDSQFRQILESRQVRHDDETVKRLRRKADDDFLKRDVEFFVGARHLIMERSRRGLVNFLSSASADANVYKRLSNGGILRHFAMHLGSSAVPKGQRHIDIFATHLGLSPEIFGGHAFFCGDGETDMRIGKSARMYAIGIEGTVSAERLMNAGADRTVQRIGALLNDPS